MPNRQQRPIIQVPLPVYGLNDRYSPYAIDDREAAAMENVVIGAKIIQTRLGSAPHGTTSGAGPIQNAVDFRLSSGVNTEVRARQSSIDKLNTSNDTWEAITLAVSLTANLKVSFATLNNLLLIANGVDNDQTWSGSGSTVARASNPKAKYQIVYQNRIVKLTDAGVLWYSDINDPTTFDALSFINIDPNNAAMGVGLAELNGQIIAFKQNKKYTVTALVNGSVIPLDGDVSTVSHYSIASTGSSLIFLGPQGFYELRGSSTSPISGRLDITALALASLGLAHATFFNDRYRCFVPEEASAYNSLEYVIYTSMRTPFPEQPYPITRNRGRYGLCYYKTLRSTQEVLYYGDSRPSSGSPATHYSKVYRVDSGFADDGTAIASFWESKLYDLSVPYFSKKYKRLYTRVVNQTGLTYYAAYRFSTTAAWAEQALVIPETLLSWVLDDLTETEEWLEAVDWPFEGADEAYQSMQNVGRPKTIQFRNRISSSSAQGQWVYQAYRLRIRNKFKR